MVDEKTKFILIQIAPLIIWFSFLIIMLFVVLIFRKKSKRIIDYINSSFWKYDEIFVEDKSEGKALGKRLFFDDGSIQIVSRHLFSSTIATIGPIIAVWWRTLLIDVKIQSNCIDEFGCFHLNASYFEVEECAGKNSVTDTLICYKLSFPNIDEFISGVGIAYGFTRIMLSINQFILDKFNLLRLVNWRKRLLLYISLMIAIFISCICLGIAIGLSDKFFIWSLTSILNYLIPFMILLSPIMSIVIFCRMNVKLKNHTFYDGVLVYRMNRK